jgi:hypothetical protein
VTGRSARPHVGGGHSLPGARSRPAVQLPPRLDPVEIVCSCQPAAPGLPMQAGAGAMGRSSLCVGLSARSLDGPWSPLPRFVLGVGVGGSRDALVHGLVRAGSCVTGERRPSDLAIAGSGSVAVPAARARVHQDGGNPGPLPGATPRSLTGYRAGGGPGFSPGRGLRPALRGRGAASAPPARVARPRASPAAARPSSACRSPRRAA